MISITHNSPSGTYHIRRADDALVEPGIAYHKAASAKYRGVVSFPTTYGILLGRILVRENNTADLDIIHGYEDATVLATTKRTSSRPYALQAPSMSAALLATPGAPDIITGLLQTLAALGPYNQPEVYSDRYNVASLLGQAGLSGGLYCPPAGVNLTAATATANASLAAAYAASVVQLGNGWTINTQACQVSFYLRIFA